MSQCSRCINFTMRDQPLKNLGLYTCTKGPKWEYPNPFIQRECRMFVEVSPEAMPARMAFEKQGSA